MSHQHSHAHHHAHAGSGGLSTAFWLNISFSLIELGGGFLTNSTAILTDAIHDFGDALAIGAGIFLEKRSATRRTPNFSYGYKRFSLLSALILSLLLVGGAIVMSIRAVSVLWHPQEVNSVGMLWLAVLGIVINGWAFRSIRKKGKENESNGHSQSHNSRAIMLHLLEDVLGWLAVLIGAIIIYFTGWYWIDPVLSLCISAFILFNGGKNLYDTMRILLQAVPDTIDQEQIRKDLLQLEGVSNVHDLHVWTLDGNYTVGTLHVVVNKMDTLACEQLRREIDLVLRKHHIDHPTVQLEPEDHACGLAGC